MVKPVPTDTLHDASVGANTESTKSLDVLEARSAISSTPGYVKALYSREFA
jgi:hypothetical protein